jgi:hypothetical protein
MDTLRGRCVCSLRATLPAFFTQLQRAHACVTHTLLQTHLKHARAHAVLACFALKARGASHIGWMAHEQQDSQALHTCSSEFTNLHSLFLDSLTNSRNTCTLWLNHCRSHQTPCTQPVSSTALQEVGQRATVTGAFFPLACLFVCLFVCALSNASCGARWGSAPPPPPKPSPRTTRTHNTRTGTAIPPRKHRVCEFVGHRRSRRSADPATRHSQLHWPSFFSTPTAHHAALTRLHRVSAAVPGSSHTQLRSPRRPVTLCLWGKRLTFVVGCFCLDQRARMGRSRWRRYGVCVCACVCVCVCVRVCVCHAWAFSQQHHYHSVMLPQVRTTARTSTFGTRNEIHCDDQRWGQW